MSPTALSICWKCKHLMQGQNTQLWYCRCYLDDNDLAVELGTDDDDEIIPAEECVCGSFDEWDSEDE